MTQSIVLIALVVRDYEYMQSQGIVFAREPKMADYGMVAVFEDLYGTLWDLIEFAPGHPNH